MTGAAAILFLGPSLPEPDRPADRFEVRPPAAQGDVYRAVLDRPRAIGLIDGYFDGVPAVWHKEILWALSQGIHVFGSSSMGALRAAELDVYGMRGVGRIYEAFRDGVLTDDDEVALVHGPGDLGFSCLSEPMVNVRATLDRAVSDRIITSDHRAALLRIAKDQFYQARNWESVIAAAAIDGLPSGVLDALRSWIAENAVDQKRRDAEELIETIDRFLNDDPPPFAPQFAFEWTEMWANAPWIDAPAAPLTEARDEEEDNLVDELRLLGPVYFEVAERALLHALTETGFEPADTAVSRKDVLSEIDRFRRPHGLSAGERFRAFLKGAELSQADFERMMAREATIRALARSKTGPVRRRIVDQLRLSGDYSRLLARSRDKADKLKGRALDGGQVHLMLEAHCRRLNCDLPSDPSAYAGDLGLSDIEALRQLLRKEEIYLKMTGEEG